MYEEYVDQLNEIQIPPDPTPAVIYVLQSKLDMLQQRASLEHTKLKAELTRLKDIVKVYSKIYYIDVKDQAKTEKEREALIYKKLIDEHMQGDKTIFEAISELEGKVAFLETLLSLISSKTQRLITVLGSLKLEHSIMAAEMVASRSSMAS